MKKNIFQNFWLKLSFILLLSFIILPQAGLTQAETIGNGPINLGVNLPGTQGQVSDAAHYIKIWYNIVIGSVGALAMIMIIINGFRWLTAAGSSGIINDAKTGMVMAVIGIIIALFSYSILYVISPKLVNLSFPGMSNVETSPAITTEKTAIIGCCKYTNYNNTFSCSDGVNQKTCTPANCRDEVTIATCSFSLGSCSNITECSNKVQQCLKQGETDCSDIKPCCAGLNCHRYSSPTGQEYGYICGKN